MGIKLSLCPATMIGKTNSLEAAPGTIRGDYAVHTNFNLIHGSDSPESAEREINNFFQPNETIYIFKEHTRMDLTHNVKEPDI